MARVLGKQIALLGANGYPLTIISRSQSVRAPTAFTLLSATSTEKPIRTTLSWSNNIIASTIMESFSSVLLVRRHPHILRSIIATVGIADLVKCLRLSKRVGHLLRSQFLEGPTEKGQLATTHQWTSRNYGLLEDKGNRGGFHNLDNFATVQL